MKHPNKKVEAIRREFAWALKLRKRHLATSCFNFWLDNYSQPAGFIPLTKESLTQALIKL
jgi:hypothetical protein